MARRLRRNDFLARPREFRGEPTRGTRRYPGFHTARDPVTAFAYAQMKVVEEHRITDDYRIDDFPVVVTMDMAGLKRLPDFDAAEWTRPHAILVAREVTGRGATKEPLEELRDYVEMGEPETAPFPDTAEQLLFEIGATAINEPAPYLLDLAESKSDPDKFLREVANGNVNDEDLMEIAGQYRYDEDVSSSRIVAVDYLQPWWPLLVDYEAEDYDESFAEYLESLGWIVLSPDDVYSDDARAELREVYRRKPKTTARIEHHGTSYDNLRSAAPHLDLPQPPSPYEL